MSETVDHWISSTYKNKPKIKAWLNATVDPLDSLEDTYRQMTYNIDQATGEQLNFIGNLVGIRRALTSKSGAFFGYVDTPGAVGYDVDVYYDHTGKSLVPIRDSIFRIAIRAKIIRNTTIATADNIILAAEFVLGVPVELVNNHTNFTLNVLEDISSDVNVILRFYNLEIRPAGIKFNGYERV